MRDLTVLVADDEAKVRKFLACVIEDENLPVKRLLEADNGIAAEALAREHAPDLIFLDIRMPGQDGIATAKNIINSGLPGKVVIVSAYNEFEYAREAFRVGVSDYLLKPVKPEDLVTFVLQAARSQPKAGQTAQQSGSSESARPALVQTVLDYIAANLNSPIRVEDIAKAVHLSPWHLGRSFKRLHGRSIIDCVRDMRIERAKALLARKDISITEIGISLGFENAGYFATCFKQSTGLSPSDFRKAQAR